MLFSKNMAGLLYESIQLSLSNKDNFHTLGEEIQAEMAHRNLKEQCAELISQFKQIQPVRTVGSEELANLYIFQTLETLARLLAELNREDGGSRKISCRSST